MRARVDGDGHGTYLNAGVRMDERGGANGPGAVQRSERPERQFLAGLFLLLYALVVHGA